MAILSLKWFYYAFLGSLIIIINFLIIHLPLTYSTFPWSPFSQSDECTILLQFNWDNNTIDCCEWERIHCDPSTGHITEIDLSFSHLTGPIDSVAFSNLFMLDHLQSLNLEGNYLTGELPSSINIIRVTSSRLSDLDLSDNLLNGTIPSWVSRLPSLKHLDLSLNHFTCTLNSLFDNATNLETLDLSYNHLTGELPSSININRGSSLLEFILTGNLLRGTIPPWVFRLPSLELLDLSYNNFTGPLSSLFDNASNSLEQIYLGYNRIYGSIPESLFNLFNLVDIYLSGNTLSGTVHLSKFSNLTHLEFLSLSDANLRVLTTSSSHGSTNSSLTLPKLSSLRLSSCNMVEFPSLGVQGELTLLDLSNNNIKGEVRKWVQDMGKDLTNVSLSLNLSHNYLTGGLEHLPWNIMDSIDISYNLFQGSVPFWLATNPISLCWLYATNNRLNGTIDPSVCNLTSLVILDLSNNRLTGKIPQCLGNKMYNLMLLNLGSNRLRGTIPREFSKGCTLEYLDLSKNQLQGVLPPSLAQCTELNFLNLGSNKLEDTFPTWLDALPNLLVLDLHFNNFHGHVVRNSKPHNPFPKLQILDLSYNNFSGELPTTYINNFQAMMILSRQRGNLQYMGLLNGDYQYSIQLSFNGEPKWRTN